YDVVFADPPYALDDAALGEVLTRLARDGWLADDADVIVERGRGGAPPWPEGVTEIRSRGYGESVLWYGRRS
ncbi:MAG: RsmD family RNA methyltransferase, partial [Stackebrandtia sp.]